VSTPSRPAGPPEYLERWQIVRQAIRDEIIDGRLRPGDVLSEGVLAERYGVSRGPIRSALQDLVRVGLVVGGATRRRLRVATFSASDVDELYDLAMTLEQAAARAAATHATAAQIAELTKALELLDEAQAVGDVSARADADLRFHHLVVVYSRNRRLLDVWVTLEEQIRFVVAITHQADPEVVWARFNKPIADAIANHDPAAAEQAVVDIYHSAYEGLRRASAALATRGA
jgi:DNA-binding GntR family transcriptional regulator